MKLKLFLIILFWMFASSSFAATYYIAANGSDSNDGTSKSTPWLHAPGMTGCSGNCASTTPKPGDKFILRGGDTWYPSGAGIPVGLPWNWKSWDGISGNNIYIGVDKTWYTGGSWTRPKLNGGNPLSTSAVASCAYQVGSDNVFMNFWTDHCTLDNIEFLGLCWTGAGGWAQNMYLNGSGLLQNLYMHGWTHTSWASGTANVGEGILGTTQQDGGQGHEITNFLCDGSDSDPTSFGCLYGDCYNLNNSTFRYNSNGAICNNMHLFYNNLFEYIYNDTSGTTHSNGWEFNSQWRQGTEPNRVYNNVVRHIGAAVTTWFTPNSLPTYVYNNLMYDIAQQAMDVDTSQNGTIYFLNNTIESGSQVPIGQAFYSGTNYIYNNHCINTGGGCVGGSGGWTGSNNLVQTQSQAASAGYSSSNLYQPTSSSSPTVGTGLNKTSDCPSAGTALCEDTTLAGTRNAISRPQSSAWSIGAYELRTDPSANTAPNAPVVRLIQ